MKYWLLTTEYPPLYGGGISTYCDHTAKMLSAKGHAVTVFIPDSQVDDYETDINGLIRVVRFNDSRSKVQDHLGHVARLSYEFAAIVIDLIRKEGKPDCIESQEYLAIPYHVLQFKLLKYPELSGVPVYLTLHSPAFLYLYYNREGIYEFPNYWIGEMEKSCIRSADALFAPSRYMVDEILKHTIVDEAKVNVLRNPYPVADAPAIRAEGKTFERNKIVFYGKLSPQKGVFELFAYFKELWDNGFLHPLQVIGGMDKVYYPEMKTMGQIIREKYGPYIKKGLVHFTGQIPPSEKDTYLSDAHVILIPSLNDNLPYAALEAMSLGKIVLASLQGGQAEVIRNGVNGFLFDHKRPASFGEQLKHILALDDDSLGKISLAAVQEIRQSLNYDVIYDQKTAIIDRIKQEAAVPGSAVFPFTRPTYPVHPMEETGGVGGLLSIVIPYYNMGAFVRDTVDSVLRSSYSPIEILIVNDGSTDPESLEILAELKKRPMISVVDKKNEGLAKTRNYGASLAKGEFLAFLDADDKVHPEYYRKAIGVLGQYGNVFFVGAWVQYFGNKSNVWPTWTPEPPYILIHNSVNSSGLVYKKAAFLAGGLNDRTADYGIEDYESVINMLKHGYRGVVLPECLFYYRVRTGSMYRALTRHKILYSYEYISGKHADFYSKFAPEIYNLLNANGPSYTYDNPTFAVVNGRWNRYKQKVFNKLKSFVKKNPALKRVLLRLKLKSR